MPTVNVTLFSQILKLIDTVGFKKLVKKHDSDFACKGINSWTHLVSMLFMHFSGVDSVRDISNGMRSALGNLSHLGVERAPAHSSVSYINQTRTHRLFEDLYLQLLERYEPSLKIRKKEVARLRKKVFLLDSTTIPLCLDLFDWARFRTRKGAVKLHAVLDHATGLPSYAVISDGATHDKKALAEVELPKGSVAVFDMAYIDYARLKVLDSTGVDFVTRAKENMAYEIVEDHDLGERPGAIIADRTVRLTGYKSAKKYPKELRLVHLWDEEKCRELIFLTNNHRWSPRTIAALYKSRWDVEIFFKHIKQLTTVKSFVGTSENAVRIQLWTAMITILLVKHLKNRAKYDWNLSNLVNFIRVTLFTKTDLYGWLDKPIHINKRPPPQPSLFE